MTTPCYICQSIVSEVRLDPRDNKIRPCLTCEEVIREAVGDFTKDFEDQEDAMFMSMSLDEYMERYES